ncbi:hypothetical protein LXL04_033215 [Taraxacum kok-saghyz]
MELDNELRRAVQMRTIIGGGERRNESRPLISVKLILESCQKFVIIEFSGVDYGRTKGIKKLPMLRPQTPILPKPALESNQ